MNIGSQEEHVTWVTFEQLLKRVLGLDMII